MGIRPESLRRIDGQLERVDLKTDKSGREVPLPRFALAALRRHRARQLDPPSSAWPRPRSRLAFVNQPHYFSRLGKALFLVLAEYQLVVDVDVEDAPSTVGQLRLDSKRLT